MSTVLVTGANRGIGLELCKQLAQSGNSVIGTCREPSPELRELGVHIEAGVDVTSDESVANLARRLEGIRIDTLVLNAGVLERDSLQALDLGAIEKQFQINAVGPLRVVRALLPNLSEGSKIALVTSRMGSIADNGSGGFYGYRMSKAALNMAGVSLARDLRGRRISVAILHPGMVATRMTGNNGIPVEESARGLLARIAELTPETSGTFRHQNGEALPW
jgi:NAD(P)-dependent dehydrogenase (short-subunit alcohol dehydrogenase family)